VGINGDGHCTVKLYETEHTEYVFSGNPLFPVRYVLF